MSRVLIRGALVRFPHLSIDRVADVLFEPGRVLGLDPGPAQARGAEIIDGRGRWLIPGLACAGMYLALSVPLSELARRLERRLARDQRALAL